jgi:hypothetical protein
VVIMPATVAIALKRVITTFTNAFTIATTCASVIAIIASVPTVKSLPDPESDPGPGPCSHVCFIPAWLKTTGTKVVRSCLQVDT